MYKDYFRFTDMPFAIAPDPRFLYMSAQHREAIAHLLYGVQGDGGFVLLTGEVGTGKTTLCRCLLEQIGSECDVAYILNPRMNAVEMLAAICDEFHLAVASQQASIKGYVDALNAHLLKVHQQSRRAVLIIDEAQNLHPDVLEQLRLLTNLETTTRKLLQIILIGQPELQDLLRRPELRQVAQRIVARYHLGHLNAAETVAFVAHRLSVAGSLAPLFPRRVLGMIHRRTGGVPRLINLVCDRALLGTFTQGRLAVNPATLRKAAREVLGSNGVSGIWQFARWQTALLALLAAGSVAAGVTMAATAWRGDWHLDWPMARRAKAPAASPAAAAPATAAATVPVAAPTPVPVPPKPVAAAQADLRWPDDVAPRSRSEELAFRELLRRHGIDYPPTDGRSPCDAAESVNLRCLTARGGFADLRRFNQPAVLLLDAPAASARFYALLIDLAADSATLVVAGAPQRVSLAKLAPMWSGQYMLLWKPPAGYNGLLSQGSRGETVTWLRRTLAQVQGGETDGEALFDAALARRVRQFQITEGITPDGIAGELTLSLLSVRADKTPPPLGAVAAGT